MRARAAFYKHRVRLRGISLVELVVVIAISGIIAATISIFILRPIQGYDAQVRRAELIDAAESALRRMQRDIRRALPNSIRIDGTGRVIEMLNTVDGGRYCADLRCTDPPAAPGDRLRFDGTDTQFDVMGPLQYASAVSPADNWLVINNLTTTGASFNAYNCPAAGASHNCVRMSAGSTNLGASPPRIALAAAFAPTVPALASPQQRFHIIDTPVTYRCDLAARTLTRHQGYAITGAQPVPPVGGTSALAADHIAGCQFIYQPGTSERAGLVTLQLTLTDTTSGESVRLLHQAHVGNVP
jgi:MSHA biogenesis protein MshO